MAADQHNVRICRLRDLLDGFAHDLKCLADSIAQEQIGRLELGSFTRVNVETACAILRALGLADDAQRLYFGWERIGYAVVVHNLKVDGFFAETTSEEFRARNLPAPEDLPTANRTLDLRNFIINLSGSVTCAIVDPTHTEPSCRHSDDFHSVVWHGAAYEFTPMQAACIKVLWQNWQKGTPELSQEMILETSESSGNRLRDVFAKGEHPAWGTMIVKGKRKGAFRLADPTDS